jgi:cytochrome c oxidase subunit IV
MKPEPPRRYVATWFALVALLALSCGSAYVRMGYLNVVANMGIALIKALLVAFVFMHIGKVRRTVWLVATAGVVWLLLLMGLSLSDFLVRQA